LQKVARERARRACRNDTGPIVLASVWQLQKRGAPHIHIVVSAGDRGRIFASAVKECARDYGFGFVDIATRTGNAAAVGSYLSGYVSSEGYLHPPEYLALLPSRRMYVSRELQSATGATMGVARRLRRLWVYGNVDRSVGLPVWESEAQQRWTYYWYRVGRRGFESVPKPTF